MGRRIKNLFEDFISVIPLPGEGRYIATVAGFREQDGTLVVIFNPEDPDNPELQYSPVCAYLNKRYNKGDVTDCFLKVFDRPKTENAVVGKKCCIDVEYRGSDNPYLTVTEIDSIE